MSNELLPKNFVKTAIEGERTPAYWYFEDIIRSNAEKIRTSLLPLNFELLFFESANRQLDVLQLIRKLGFGLTVVSWRGVERGIRAGFAVDQIECSGFGISLHDMRFMLTKGVFINVGSLREAECLAESFPTASIGLRVELAGDKDDKRGVTPEQFVALANSEKLNITAIHTYGGTNLISRSHHFRVFKELYDLAQSLSDSARSRIRTVNVGGGFGFDYADGSSFDWAGYGCDLADWKKSMSSEDRQPPIVKIEIGRSLVANAGVLLTKILYAFTKNTRNYVVTDSNISCFPRPARYGFSKQHHPFLEDGRHRISLFDINGYEQSTESSRGVEVAVVGNSHYSKDWLGFVNLPSFRPAELEGGYLVFRDAGAYCEVMSDDWADQLPHQSYMLASVPSDLHDDRFAETDIVNA